MDEQQFYEYLTNKTAQVFQRSPIKQKQESLGNYAVCATPIQREKGIIFGLNWRAEKNKPYRIPDPNIMSDGSCIKNYPFVIRAKPYLSKYLGLDVDHPDFNYTNLCFFRSYDTAALEERDWANSMELFMEYVDYIDPPFLLMLGTTQVKRLRELPLLSGELDKHIHLTSKALYSSYSVLLKNGSKLICVPHPQARLSNTTRHELWKKACRILDE